MRLDQFEDKPYLDAEVLLDKGTDQGKTWNKRGLPVGRSLFRFVLLVLLLGSGFAVYRVVFTASVPSGDRPIQTTSVERSNLSITISANGTIEPKQSTNVSPKTSGRLKSILVQEGDTVTAGQALAYMDDSDLQGQRLEAQGQLAGSQANLNKLLAGDRPEEKAQAQARLNSAEASLQQAEADFRRYDQLYAAGAISAQERDTARYTRNSALAAVEEAQQALDLSQIGSRQEDIDQARAQVIQSQGALKTIQTQIEDTVIRAPFGGVVITQYADPGDFVAPTTSASENSSATSSSILMLGSTYQIVANVAESNIGKIQLGQSVSIVADAYPSQTFTGKVAQIAEGATVESNVTSFEVRVDILSDNKQLLRSGMNVDTQFQVGEVQQAIVVPTVAIVRRTDQTGVLILGQNGQPVFTPIETGVTVGKQTEVVSGLTGNEQVVTSAPMQTPAASGERSLLPLPGRPPQ